jgi:hypothetical protein
MTVLTLFMNYLINKCRVIAALTLGMALLIMLVPWPGQAGRMQWSTVDTPSPLFNTIASQSEISALAMSTDGRTFYAADTANSRLYRSDDAGVSWMEISRYLVSSGATLPVWNISIAPGNPQFIAAVTSAGGLPRGIFVSQDGGQSWSDTNFAVASNISALAVSPGYGYFDIAAGTRSGGTGNVYIYRASGSGGAWSDQGFSGDVLAIRFSSNYRSDTSIAVLYSTSTGTYFNTGLHDLNANTTDWTTLYNGSPPEVATAGAGTSPKSNQVIGGDLELPVDYSGQSPSMCRAYISLDSTGGNAGVFRIDGTVVYQLLVATGSKRISSIAYFGAYAGGKLLAGEVNGDPLRASVPIWYTDAPMGCPAACWYMSEKPPTGGATSGRGNAQVIWTPDGSRAYCGTGSALLNNHAAWPAGYLAGAALDESAFSTSMDNGRTWNQLSLIDTQIDFLSDVAVTADATAIYIASINTSGAGLDSIWRSGSQLTGKSWDRVLCLPSATNDLILRTSTYGNGQAIFFASRGTDDLRQSQDGGQNWQAQLPGKIVSDFSVTSVNNTRYLYVLSGSTIRRANVSSLMPQWSQQVATTLTAGHTIFAAPNGTVLVGGDSSDSRVAYSMDGGNSFVATPSFPVQGRIHALADYRLGQNVVIYAAADSPDSDMYYWIAGASTAWDVMGAPTSQFWGLAQMGTLYGASTNALLPTVDRTLSPESLGPPVIEWDTLGTGLAPGISFTREPTSLKLSAGVNLWAIDNRAYHYAAGSGRLWTFCDCLSPTPQYKPPPTPSKEALFAPPVAVLPRPDDLIPIFIADNSVGEITLQWKHNTTAVAYEVRVAADKGFTGIIAENVVKPQRRAPSWTITDKKGFEPGKTFYWQVRVIQAATGEKGSGQWSEISSFTIAENKAETYIIAPIATDNKSTEPSKPVIPLPPAPSDNSSKAGSAAADIYLAIYAVSGLLAGILITILAVSLISRNRR